MLDVRLKSDTTLGERGIRKNVSVPFETQFLKLLEAKSFAKQQFRTFERYLLCTSCMRSKQFSLKNYNKQKDNCKKSAPKVSRII
jgi:hypothetical protein